MSIVSLYQWQVAYTFDDVKTKSGDFVRWSPWKISKGLHVHCMLMLVKLESPTTCRVKMKVHLFSGPKMLDLECTCLFHFEFRHQQLCFLNPCTCRRKCQLLQKVIEKNKQMERVKTAWLNESRDSRYFDSRYLKIKLIF